MAAVATSSTSSSLSFSLPHLTRKYSFNPTPPTQVGPARRAGGSYSRPSTPGVNLTQKAAIFVAPMALSPRFTLPHATFRRERLMLPKHRLLLLNQLRQVCAIEEDYVCCLHKVCGDVDGKSRLQSQVQLLLHRRQI